MCIRDSHEAIFQIGNLNDCGCGTEGGHRAAEALTGFAKTFQERNPHLHVFNMVLHMDEATPNLHVDYIPAVSYTHLYPGGHGADERPFNESVHEAGAQAAGLYRRWPETDRVEGLDLSLIHI